MSLFFLATKRFVVYSFSLVSELNVFLAEQKRASNSEPFFVYFGTVWSVMNNLVLFGEGFLLI